MLRPLYVCVWVGVCSCKCYALCSKICILQAKHFEDILTGSQIFEGLFGGVFCGFTVEISIGFSLGVGVRVSVSFCLHKLFCEKGKHQCGC